LAAPPTEDPWPRPWAVGPWTRMHPASSWGCCDRWTWIRVAALRRDGRSRFLNCRLPGPRSRPRSPLDPLLDCAPVLMAHWFCWVEMRGVGHSPAPSLVSAVVCRLSSQMKGPQLTGRDWSPALISLLVRPIRKHFSRWPEPRFRPITGGSPAAQRWGRAHADASFSGLVLNPNAPRLRNTITSSIAQQG